MEMKRVVLPVISIIIISMFSGCINLNDDNSDDSVALDSDHDGVPDNMDDFPFDPSEQNDSDDDGVGDNSDKFPSDPAASIDSDNDGYPDRWNTKNEGKDSETKSQYD